MPLSKILGLASQGITNPYQVNKHVPDVNFVKDSYNFGKANPNCPEHRGDGVHGQKLYCLA